MVRIPRLALGITDLMPVTAALAEAEAVITNTRLPCRVSPETGESWAGAEAQHIAAMRATVVMQAAVVVVDTEALLTGVMEAMA